MYSQNTPEWNNLRKNKIGSSDAPIIMQSSPWKTPFQLWQEKLGLISNEVTSSMRRGMELEEKARETLSRKLNLILIPKVIFHAQIQWMMASLDACDSEDKVIAEIKCPGKEDHSKTFEGLVPDKYYPQLQHQMEVAEVDKCYYFSFDGQEGNLVTVYRNDSYIKKLLIKEKEFWQHLQEMIPPEFTDKDYELCQDPEWINLGEELKQIKNQMDDLKKLEEEKKRKLIEISNGKNMRGGGVKLTKILSKGRIDYDNIEMLKSIDLNKYRKPSVLSYRLSYE